MSETNRLNGWVRCLSSTLDSGLLLLDETGELSLINRQARAQLGHDEDELAARWPELRRRIEEQQPGALAGEGEREVRVHLPVGGDEGERAFLLEIVPVDVDECRGHMLMLRDCDQVQRAERDMLLASQMHSISALYRSMAHDLRAPLNAMVVNLELLSDSVEPGAEKKPNIDERRRRYVRVLKEEMERLNRHLLAFLSQSSPAVDGHRRFNLVPMLREMALFVEPQAKKQKTEVELVIDADEVRVDGEPDALRQAFLSLVVNALEAVEEQEDGWVELGLEQRGEQALVWVADSGEGVSPEAAQRIFDLYYTTKKDGSGIGLHVARRVVERHGGTLELVPAADPELDGGARFEITLPTRAAQAAEES